MPVTISGSPTHVLIVLIMRVMVVLLPVAVVASLIVVAVPATRRPFSVLTLLVAFISCAAIPFAFSADRTLSLGSRRAR